MKIGTLNFFLKYALKSLRRNANNSISSIATVMSTLVLLGMFVLIILNINMGIIGVYSRSEIRAFLKNDIKVVDQQNIYNKIKTINGVTDIAFENDTPLSAAYIINVNDPNDIPEISSQINGLQSISKISSGQNIPKKILVITKIIQCIGIILFIILIVTSIFLIKNTIKIAIYPRRDEFSIMQYVGATNWFIRWPVIIEGMIIGFLGAVSAVIAIYILYNFLYRQVASYLETMFISFVNPAFILTTISWSFILIGIGIGAIGSIFVIRKFLIV